MNQLPDYSVLMSVYANDNPAYLDQAIESMAGQDLPFGDFVLVCDGPVSREIDQVIAVWRERLDTRMTVVRLEENGGLGNALNAGLSRCKCDYVARMDSDDLSRPRRCSLLLSKLVEDDLDLVGGSIEEFTSNPGDLGSIRTVPCCYEAILQRVKTRNPFNHVSVMFKRAAVENVGGYQHYAWMEDYWLWARMLASGCRCANIEDVLVDVRTGNGMYKRRSNTAYLKSQLSFFEDLRRLGLINRFEQLSSSLIRTLITMMPVGMVESVYNRVLREKKEPNVE